jgi:lysophospholipase L1-like esterase
MIKINKYLALGDSYTIGESVPTQDSFPYQLATILRQNNSPVEHLQVIAKTGWTTDELSAAIDKEEAVQPILHDHDLVTLLIGVNDQYRGRPVESFEPEFERLLIRALKYAANDPERVRVLSIPDWGVTPYAVDRNREKIASAIDQYNGAKERICQKHGVRYIYITDLTREASAEPELITSDGLHPSGKDYYRWAERVWSSLRTK